MPEQFAFEQILGDSGAVDRNEGAVAPPARLVQPARQQLLAGAARAEQHHRYAQIGDALDRPRDLQHLGRPGDHPAEHAVVARPLLRQPRIFDLEFADMERPPHDQPQFLDIDRLLVEIPGALRDRVQRAGAFAMPRHDDDLGIGLDLQDRLQSPESLARPVGIGRQAQVERDHIGFFGTQQVDRAVMVARDQHRIAVIGPFELRLQPRVVLDHQQFARCFGAVVLHDATFIQSLPRPAAPPSPAAGSHRVKRLPLPGSLTTSIVPPIACAICNAS